MKAWMRSFGILSVSGLLFFSAACGGDDGGPLGSATPPGTSSAPAIKAGNGVPTKAVDAGKRAADAKQKLTACLRKEGMNGLPSPGASLSPKERESAQKCAAEMLMGTGSDLQRKVELLRTCMKKKGLPVPPAGQPFVPKADDPRVAAAMRACQKSLVG